MGRNNRGTKLVSVLASLALVVGLMPLPALADDAGESALQNASPSIESHPIATQSISSQPDATAQPDAAAQPDSEEPKADKHSWGKHAGCYTFDQSYGQNTVLLKCEWSQDIPLVGKSQCEFWEWPLIIMNRPDDFYDGTPKAANWYVQLMHDYPYGKQTPGFPDDIAEWDGEFTYTGIGGTKYGPTSQAPIAAGSYHVYTRIRVPDAVDPTSDGSFTLAKTFTIRSSAYDVTFDPNPPANASTKNQLSGTMPTQHFDSAVQTHDLAPNQFKLPGYQFDSWNTKPDGSGTKYANRESVKGLSTTGTNVTLYAQWKPLEYTLTFLSDDAGSERYTQNALFDQSGTLDLVATFGWNLGNKALHGWRMAVSALGLLYDDGEDFCNLCEFNASGDLVGRNLLADWIIGTKIVVSVTKDGEPQAGFERSFVLKRDTTEFTVPFTYDNGRYEFDPTQSLGSGDYTLCFNPPEGSEYEPSSIDFTYVEAYSISTIFDYYTVTLKADPAFKDVHTVQMAGKEPDANGVYTAFVPDNSKLTIKTDVSPGYHFDGYSAIGVTPQWEGNDPLKAEQTISVRGQADIMAHVEANVYTVHFDANAKDGAIGQMADQDMVYDEPQNLFANQFQRAGDTFKCWNTKPDGTGTSYTDKQSVKNLTTENGGEVTLYAQWNMPAAANKSENDDAASSNETTALPAAGDSSNIYTNMLLTCALASLCVLGVAATKRRKTYTEPETLAHEDNQPGV